MDNPWIHLPAKPPYVLASDLPVILDFNKKSANQHQIKTDILPEPFLGNLQMAKIVLLNLNPGFDDRDYIWHNNAIFSAENRNDLLHESNPPFYLLNTKFSGSAGFEWWFDHLRQWIIPLGIEKVAREFMCIEYFPYHSKKYKQMHVLASQNYSFFLAHEAIRLGKIIIIMRGRKLWLRALPELNNYSYITLNSSQNVCVTENNLPDGIFRKLLLTLG